MNSPLASPDAGGDDARADDVPEAGRRLRHVPHRRGRQVLGREQIHDGRRPIAGLAGGRHAGFLLAREPELPGLYTPVGPARRPQTDRAVPLARADRPGLPRLRPVRRRRAHRTT